MVAEKGALLQDAQRELKGALHFARAMVGVKGVLSKVAEFVQRVCMEVPTSVWHTGEVRGVPCLSAQKVLGDGLTTVFAMVGASGASLKGVARVPREALISARHMVEESDALGAIPDQNMAANLLVLVTRLPGEKQDSVLSTVAWCRTGEFMEVSP